MANTPDIILILTDNQQATTLGCYGNSEIHTPHLDRLAAEGVRFDNAFCPNAFCSPCRASVMTGEMPSFHGVHAWIDDRNMDDWPPEWHALRGLTTLPERLRAAGYATGIFGKYHLGHPQSPAPGWDRWVTMADGHVRSFYDNTIFDDGRTYAQPGHSVDFFTDKALEFLGQGDSPRFAYLPLPAPYGHWPATSDGRRNSYAGLYDDCPMASVPREPISAAAVRHYDRVKATSGGGLDFSMLMRAPNDLATLRNYYSQITMIDAAVGRIRAAAPEALILFTADHGLSLGHHGFWGHGAATYPANMHRAAHSIPLIAHHPASIPAGQTEARHVSGVDLFNTILDLAGAPGPRSGPGRSLVPLMQGIEPHGWGADEIYAEQEETRVIRTPEWLLFLRPGAAEAPEMAPSLFDLRADPHERVDLGQSPDHQAVVARLTERIETWFSRHSRPQADLWRGGKPIQNSTRRTFWQDIWGADWHPLYAYDDG